MITNTSVVRGMFKRKSVEEAYRIAKMTWVYGNAQSNWRLTVKSETDKMGESDIRKSETCYLLV